MYIVLEEDLKYLKGHNGLNAFDEMYDLAGGIAVDAGSLLAVVNSIEDLPEELKDEIK